MTLATLETTAIEPEMPVEQVAEILQRLDLMKRAIREADERLTQGMIGWIQANGATEIGDIRYYVGTRKTTKLRDGVEALASLLEQFTPEQIGRDFLASSPFKYGAIRQACPELFERLFEVSEEPELREGKPKQQLMKVDKRYLR